MDVIVDYEKQVYAGILGKVIGVYMGRPFEGWPRDRIEARWGSVNRYVHEDLNKPLVVPDDDISGTLTFVRALEDSERYADTPAEMFGDTWLNYLIERKTVLWWGGMGHSTEHTAYLRLKQGMRAPASGAIETNGKTVAEQIGAQIFIDAFGLVAPGRPDLAAELARRSASVSHDGEAVYAAMVVAAMISAAFTEKDMAALLDTGISLIPADSLIARVHRDVRQWCREDGDWRKTYDRIAEVYGYQRYGGNCHVVPNHALMVMAWAYAPDDFHRAQTIVNTAGWDTDCNAANVGTLMGLVVGLDRLCDTYDFRTPMAGRIILPTAEGTRGATDCLTEALHLSRIGRRIMEWPMLPPPKQGAWHHFSFPGSTQGWLPETRDSDARGCLAAGNGLVPGTASRGLCIRYETSVGRCARASTPVLPAEVSGTYGIQAVPRIYPGMTVTATGVAVADYGDAHARLFARLACNGEGEGDVLTGTAVPLPPGGHIDLVLAMPPNLALPVQDIGMEITSKRRARGRITLSEVRYKGGAVLYWPEGPPLVHGHVPGWVVDADILRGPFSDSPAAVKHVGKNEARGILVTGTSEWTDTRISAKLGIHLASLGGIVVHYQGLERYIALVKTAQALKLIRRWYGKDTVLAETRMRWDPDDFHEVALRCDGARVSCFCDGGELFSSDCGMPCRGGAGFVFENGLIGMYDVCMTANVDPLREG